MLKFLSESTESYDRGDKFYFYRQIPSFKEYILVAQNKLKIDVFARGAGELWNINRYAATNEILKIDAVNSEILIEAIYRNVVFEI